MAFNDIDSVAAATALEVLGQTVTYTPSGGDAVSLNAIIDYNVDVIDAVYGEVGERRNEITFLKADIPSGARGSSVSVDSVLYTLQDLLDSDGITERWSLRYV